MASTPDDSASISLPPDDLSSNSIPPDDLASNSVAPDDPASISLAPDDSASISIAPDDSASFSLAPYDSASISPTPDDAAICDCSCSTCMKLDDRRDEALMAYILWRVERNKKLYDYFKNGYWDQGEVTQEDYLAAGEERSRTCQSHKTDIKKEIGR